MSADGDRQSVLRTTKVRTALKGDSSWIQQQNQSVPEEDEDKPWLAEARGQRLSSDFTDEKIYSGQDSSNTDRTSGYLIRGVFTKTDTKTAAPSTNGYLGTSGFTKKVSGDYKKIAPHNVRLNVEKAETSVSTEEQDRRTEAASKILDGSARKQRSYVLSAAKKYEATSEKEEITTLPATSFVAKRIVITEDEDTPKQSEEMSVDEPILLESSAPDSELAEPEPTPKQSTASNDLFDKLVSTPTSTSLKTDETVTTVFSESVKVSTPKSTTTSVDETIIKSTSVAPVATLKTSETTKQKLDPIPALSSASVVMTSTLNDKDLLGLSGSPSDNSDPVPNPSDLLTGDALPKTEKTKGSLDLLAFDVIPIDTNTDKLSTHNTSNKIEISRTVVHTKMDVKSVNVKSETNNSTLLNNDFLDLSQSTKQMEPISSPTTTDLLKGGSLPQTQKTTVSLDKLAYDVIPIDTNQDILSSGGTQTQVSTQTTVIQTKTVEKSNNIQKQTVSTTFEQNSLPRQKEKELEPDAKKNVVCIKQYLNSDPSGYSSSGYNTEYDYVTSSSSNYSYSSCPSTENMTACTYCGDLVGNNSKITIEHLKISCHPECFKCGICSKPMGDFLHSMFLHRGTVHCESCYSNVI